MDLLQALVAEGVNVVPERNWATRTARKQFTPVGIVIHHTAGSGEGGYHIIRDGRKAGKGVSALPGPLANLHPRKDGRVHLLTGGAANHAGSGDQRVLDAVQAGRLPDRAPSKPDTQKGGNRWFYGIEIENLGTGRDPFPAVQMDAVTKCVVAICRMKGWGPERVIGHKEWTHRKFDPAFGMGEFRNRVAAELGQPPLSQPGTAPVRRRPATDPTEIDRDLIDRAAALGLFTGDPAYYHPGGGATDAERHHFVTVVFQAAVERLETT